MIRVGAKLTKFDLFVFWFVIIDNLFLPYFWVKMVSYSFPFVFLWCFVKVLNSKINNRQFRLMFVLSGISTLLGCLLYPKYASDDIVLYLNLLLAIMSYQLFCYVRHNTTVNISKKVHFILFFFIVFVFLFSLIFYSDFSAYEQLRHIFTPRLEESGVDVLSGSIRFGYYWSDENNIAYMVCGIAIFLLFSNYIPFIWKNLLIAMAVVIVVATMSTGGIVSLAITLFAYGVYLLVGRENRLNPFVKILFLIVIAYVFVFGLNLLFNSEVFQLMTDRFEGKTGEGGDTRSSIYKTVLESTEWWKYIIWGYGGRTIIGGVYRSPHNGILHFIVAYGMIVCYKYVKFYFFKGKQQKWIDWAWRVPVLIGFMINIMITEDKIHVIMMLLLAFETRVSVKNRTIKQISAEI